MEINFLEKIGIIIAFLDIFWILIYYYYGAVKVYNFVEKKRYQYLGCIWIHRKKGEYYLKIPREMMKESFTTKYKIIPDNLFVKRKREQRLRICFDDKYEVYTMVSGEMTVKNHIATSSQL